MNVAKLRHLVTLQNPGALVPGGFAETFTALSPAQVWAEIKPATARDLERVAAGTVMSTATHVVSMRHHSQVSTQTQIVFGTRTFSVTGVTNPDERNIETVCICVEVVQ